MRPQTLTFSWSVRPDRNSSSCLTPVAPWRCRASPSPWQTAAQPRFRTWFKIRRADSKQHDLQADQRGLRLPTHILRRRLAGPYNEPATVGSATFASVFNGANPNGTWSLYVVDDVSGDNWNIASGWDLIVTVASNAATATTLTSSQNPSFTTAPNNSTTFTATVSSSGSPVTVGSVTFTANGSVDRRPNKRKWQRNRDTHNQFR